MIVQLLPQLFIRPNRHMAVLTVKGLNLQETSNMINYRRICAELQWPVHVHMTNPAVVSKASSSSSHELEILQKVNMNLATELHVSQSALSDQKQKLEELIERLSRLNIRNINKRLK